MPKKKRKNGGLLYSPESVGSVKKSLRSFNWRRVITLALLTLAAFSVFEALLAYEEQREMTYSIVTAVYYAAITILGAAVVILNHGFSKKPFTPDMIREEVSSDEAAAICAKLNRHKELSKKLMMALVPFLLALLLDIIYLFYGDILSVIIGLFVPSSQA